jgi:hypothetical protein
MVVTVSRALFLSLIALGGCAPPPVPGGVGGDPEIELLYPPRDAGTLPLDDQGRLSFLVVVSVDNLEFVTPSDDNEDVDGQGHFHLSINDVYIDAPPHQYYQYVSAPGDYTVDQGLSVRVSVQSNTHRDLDASAAWEDIAEYTVGEAPTP